MFLEGSSSILCVFVTNMILVWLFSIKEATVVWMFIANTCKVRGPFAEAMQMAGVAWLEMAGKGTMLLHFKVLCEEQEVKMSH